MKNKYRCYWLLVALLPLVGASAGAQSALRDSVIISFDEQTRMVIYSTDRNEIRKLSQYDLNKLIRDVLSKLDSVSPGNGVSKDWVDGNNYLKEDSAKPAGRLELAPPRTPKKDKVRGIDAAGSEERSALNGSVPDEEGREYSEMISDTVGVRSTRLWARRSPRQGIDLKIGLNTYAAKSAEGYDLNKMDLRSGASRFVNVGIVRSVPVLRGGEASFFMDLGLDISWYNLMFEGNQVIRKEDEGIVFTTLNEAGGREVSLKKNKLVAPHIDLSMMPTVTFAGSVVSHLSMGGYLGYRVGGYQVSRAYGERRIKRNRDYHMRDVRYGVAFELGIRSFPDLFVNYDLNGFFEPGKGPQVRMVSFGLKM